MKQFALDDHSCSNLEKALTLEWLDTNGLGGYDSIYLFCNTRKYHGLLVANLRMPKGRHVLLSWIEDAVISRKKELFLSWLSYSLTSFSPTRNISSRNSASMIHPGLPMRRMGYASIRQS